MGQKKISPTNPLLLSAWANTSIQPSTHTDKMPPCKTKYYCINWIIIYIKIRSQGKLQEIMRQVVRDLRQYIGQDIAAVKCCQQCYTQHKESMHMVTSHSV